MGQLVQFSITFALMLYYFGANNADQQVLFQTGWFIEGLITQTLIVHVIRTRQIPFIQSRASLGLTLTTLCVIAIAIGLIYTPFAEYIPFKPLPAIYFPFLIAINIILAQIAKSIYYYCYGVK